MIDVLDYTTDRINRARLKLELRRAVRPALIVLVCAAGGLALLALTISQVTPTALTGTYQARFELADATGVTAGIHEVRFKGIPVGEISELEFEGTRPVATVKIRKEHGRIFRDVRAQLRPTTALQDMYLDIVDRGSRAAGELSSDDIVPASQTATPVHVSEVLNMFAPTERRRLRTLLDDLGNGMADRGASLRSIFVEAVPFLRLAGDIAQQLRERRPMVARLVRNTGVLTGELGDREAQLRRVLREGSGTLSALQAGRGDLDALLRGLPPTLSQLDSGLTAARGVLDDVDGAVTALGPVVDELPASLASLRAVSTDATPAVRALRRPVRELRPLARTLAPLAGDLDTAVTTLLPQIDTVDKVTKGAAGCKQGIQGFFQWNASMAKFGDARGPIPRGNVTAGAQSSAIVSDPNEFAPQACTPGRAIGGRVPTAKDMH
ncbi:MAG TPA: MlaD family protein [Baekduia sp.]|nr:MlaD family protein [Baekduia sp.]